MMSTTDPAVTPAAAAGGVTIPPGVRVQPGRQTTQTNGFGVVTQGTLYPIILANGTTASVFVPNDLIGNNPAIQALFEQVVNGLNAIPVG